MNDGPQIGSPAAGPRRPPNRLRQVAMILVFDLGGPLGAWRYPGFRRRFRVITLAWGIGYLVEVAVRVVIVQTTSTGIALVCSKLLPSACAAALSVWTLAYGEHEKKKAERLAAGT